MDHGAWQDVELGSFAMFRPMVIGNRRICDIFLRLVGPAHTSCHVLMDWGSTRLGQQPSIAKAQFM